MRPQVSTPGQILALIASRQHGIVTHSQLLDAGFERGAIKRRVHRGVLIARHRGVYAVGHLPPSPYARAMAAVLACGPGAVLSHRSAAALYGLMRWAEPLDVTARTDHTLRGIRVHRARSLTEADRTVHYAIPATTPARTLVDLATTLDPAALTRAVNDLRISKLMSLDSLRDQLARSPGRATRAFRLRDGAPTRSAFEDAFLAFTDRHGLPRPEPNVLVAGYLADMLWRPQRLVAELDGREFHVDFEADRERDAELLAAGFRTVRVTWLRLHEAELKEARRFASLLISD
jgi:hypothetical protein